MITAVITGSIVVLMAGAIFLDVMIGFEIQKLFDTALLNKARALQTLTEQEPEGIVLEFADEFMPEFQNEADPQYFQLWLNGDTVLERSRLLGGSDLPRLQTPLNQHTFADVKLPDGREGRLVELVFVPRVEEDEFQDGEPIDYGDPLTDVEEPQVTLVVTRERVSLQNMRWAIRSIIAAAMLSVLLAVAVLIKKYVSSGLLPLDKLAEQVKAIDEQSLDCRVMHVGDQSIELAPIERQINSLLTRLEAAFEREKRFSSDVAHELRTPLTELKTLAEVGTMKLDDPVTTRAFYADVKAISTQMEKLVTDLLQLARADAGLFRMYPEEVRLRALINSAWTNAGNALAREERFQNEVPREIRVRTDREKLELILRNLLSNAASYSPPDTCIRAWAINDQNDIELIVENLAANLEPADLRHMQERFWRKERARSDGTHLGLGLALSSTLAHRMGLNLELSLDEEKKFRATLHCEYKTDYACKYPWTRSIIR